MFILPVPFTEAGSSSVTRNTSNDTAYCDLSVYFAVIARVICVSFVKLCLWPCSIGSEDSRHLNSARDCPLDSRLSAPWAQDLNVLRSESAAQGTRWCERKDLYKKA